MSEPTLSLIVPTHREDRPLRRCLDSVAGQLGPADEVIVVGDTFDAPLPGVESLVASYGPRYRYVAHDAGCHDYGHSQVNYGLTLATGDYIHLNDDDDVWTSDALAAFRTAIGWQWAEPRPFLFRFQSWVGPVFWAELGHFERNWIGGHCLLFPNDQARIGRFGAQYNGDFDFVEQTVNFYGGHQRAIWMDQVIAVARP